MKAELLNELYRSFENIKEKPGSGKYKYVPSTDVIDRMNRVFEGNWTTEVIEAEVVEDNVLVRVRVYVEDNGRTCYHDGYGSSQIARFSYGDNKGKAINIGNNYNSAKSLAIKDACKKWGVALYIEDNPYDEEFGSEHVVPEPKNESPQRDVKPAIPRIPPVGGLDEPAIPTVPTDFVPPFPDEPSTQPVKEDPFGNEKPGITQTTTNVEKITDVQRVAIQGLLELKKLDYKELLVNALGRTDNLPDLPEGLTYQDAAAVIKYGNKVKK